MKQVMGDSSLFIIWMKNEIQILNINRQALAQQVNDVSSIVLQIHYQHVYMENSEQVDQLPKDGLVLR